MDKQTKKKLVVVYGSGASFASGYTARVRNGDNNSTPIPPPTDQAFFNAINHDFLKKNYYALWMFKDLYFGPNDNIGMEEVWTALDLNFKHIKLDTYDWKGETDQYLKSRYRRGHGSQYNNLDLLPSRFNSYGMFDTSPRYNKYKFLADCGRDFRNLIYHVYSDYAISGSPDYYKALHDKITKSSHCDLMGYITFNYDCFLENSLNDIGFKYITANTSESIETLTHGEIPIIKLHGSLSWEEKHEEALYQIRQYGSPYSKDSQVRPSYESDHQWIQPAIIPPTIFKQEINDDSRTANPLTQTILQQWRSAITLLSNADIIVIVGYSFPASDFHSRRIFQISRMRQKRDGNHQKITILDCTGPKEKEKEREKILKNIFGENVDIKVTHGFDSLPQSTDFQKLL